MKTLKPAPTNLMNAAELRCFASAPAGLRELPREILAVPWGVNETPNGRLVCNEVTAKTLPLMQKAMNWEEPHSDLEHNSVARKGFTPPEPQVSPSRGSWEVRTPQMCDAPGLYFVTKEWTEEGRQIVAGGSYPRVSAAVQTDEKDQIIFGHSLAFCRQGAVTGARLFNVSLPGLTQQNQTTKTKMDLTKLIEAARAAGYDVPDDATVETLAALFKPKQEDAGEVKMFTAMMGKVEALVKGVNERLDTAEKNAADRERTAAIAQLTQAGVVIPLSADSLRKFSAEEILKEAEGWERGAVPMDGGGLVQGAVRTFSANGGVTAADKAGIAAQLGLEADELK